VVKISKQLLTFLELGHAGDDVGVGNVIGDLGAIGFFEYAC
jgi:hypothetical protein